jgi:hypothetical protein
LKENKQKVPSRIYSRKTHSLQKFPESFVFKKRHNFVREFSQNITDIFQGPQKISLKMIEKILIPFLK